MWGVWETILPDKSITLRYSLLGAGSKILAALKSPKTVSSLRDKVKKYEELKKLAQDKKEEFTEKYQDKLETLEEKINELKAQIKSKLQK